MVELAATEAGRASGNALIGVSAQKIGYDIASSSVS